MRVTIGIATYLRPQGLSKTLEGVRDLLLPEGCEFHLVIADNDEQGSARTLCALQEETFPFPLHYLKVEQRGISFVRNQVANYAVSLQSDFLAFLDDDEIPDSRWLCELLAIQRAFQADLVGGPVIRVFPEGTPAWNSSLCFFEARQEPSGLSSRNIDCGNALVAISVFTQNKLFFDEDFALTGGEDAMFSVFARRSGLITAWADRARVYETVPADRLRIPWLLSRSFRVGTVTVMVERRLFSLGVMILRNMGKVVIYFAAGLVAGLASCGVFPYQKRRSLIFLSRAAGLVCGLFGLRQEGYRRTTGG